jgi:hypothetical protein
MRHVAIATVVASLCLTACGGGSTSASKPSTVSTVAVSKVDQTVAPTIPDDPANSVDPTDTTLPEVTSLPAGDGSGDGDSEFCAQAQELSDSDAFSGQLPTSQDQIDSAQQGLLAVATVAPVELRESVDTLASFYRDFGPQLLLVSAPQTTDPAQAAAAVQALAILTPQFETVRPAIEQVSTYLRTKCGLAGG